MKAVLLVAHGSRRSQSNDEVRALLQTLAPRLEADFGHIGCAFLELAEPSIETAIDDAVAAGAKTVQLFPYFLAAGRHIQSDIPEIIARKQAEHPEVEMEMLDHLGRLPGMAEMIVQSLKSQ